MNYGQSFKNSIFVGLTGKLIILFALVILGVLRAGADELKIATAEEVFTDSEPLLHKLLYVIHTKAVPGREEDILGDVGANHMKFQVELEEKGIMFAAGPLMNQDEEYWGGEGLVIIRAESLADAKRIAASDPMHKAGARSFTVQPWLINEGGFTLSISFSDGKYEID